MEETANKMQGTQEAKQQLQILDYYLTFIHFFGFSINPSDDLQSRYLSAKVRRAAEMAAASPLEEQTFCPLEVGKQQAELVVLFDRHSQEASNLGLKVPKCQSESWRSVASALRLMAKRMRTDSVGPNQNNLERPAEQQFRRLMSSTRLKLALKYYAITLTTFLALNHVVVLVDYVFQGTKAFMELLLELRLVLTKFSALIFVLAWHRNETEVRQLIKLISSTTSNILTNEDSDKQQQQPIKSNNNCDTNKCLKKMTKLSGRIVNWWLMCVLIPVTHFSLSEAEIRTAQHLWTWLDDYSLHQLSNETTSNSTLFLMASFDNYIYTVHVYGTRLIGASIICIVCTFQIESIKCLRRRALSLMQPSASICTACSNNGRRRLIAPASWSQWPSLASPATPMLANVDSQLGNRSLWHPCDLGAERVNRWTGCEAELNRSLFFVLAESDWLEVQSNWRLALISRQSPAIGWLCTKLTHFRRQLIIWLSCCWMKFLLAVHNGLLAFAERSSTRRLQNFQGSKVARKTWYSSCRVTPSISCTIRPERKQAKVQLNQCSCRQHANQTCCLANGTCAGRQMGRQNETTPKVLARPLRWRFNENNMDGNHYHYYYYNYQDNARVERQQNHASLLEPPSKLRVASSAGQCNCLAKGLKLEAQLEELARKYELVRTVNLRVDNCFGQMLLGQYSFLFLMSCIDVVYFSLSFNPNTKTKYIIISGMILLWWPYLLLYKFASDIGTASKKLLVSVRRLARLALVVRLEEAELQIGDQGTTDNNKTHGDMDWHRQQASLFNSCFRSPFHQQFLYFGHNQQNKLNTVTSLICGNRWRRRLDQTMHLNDHHAKQTKMSTPEQQQLVSKKSRARIFNKLDHIFKTSYLSIMGIMPMDKFFLLNFAKIVITASVMTIQFISR